MTNTLEAKNLTLDSREVAEMVEKKHCHLVRDIEKYSEYLQPSTESNFGLSEFFIKSSYRDCTGRTLPCYLITRKGCEFIAHKMTGRKGAQFTAAYINKFHEMEDRLQEEPKKLLKPEYANIGYNFASYKTTIEVAMDQDYVRERGIDHPYRKVESIIKEGVRYKNTLFKPDEPAQIIPKYYRGIPVVTIQDVVNLSGLSETTVRYHIKKLNAGADYFVVNGVDLCRFKQDNPCLCKVMNCITAITKSGFKKLAKCIHGVSGELSGLPDKRLPEEPKRENDIELDPMTNRLFDIWARLDDLQKAEACGYMNRMMA